MKGNTRNQDDVYCRVICGLLPGMSEELKAGLRAPAPCTIFRALMLGAIVCGDFDLLERELRKRTDSHKFLITGDFNVSHAAWGYLTTTKKGARVDDTAQQYRLTVWNDPLQTTRVENSDSRDPNPDLTATLNVRSAEWSRLPETLRATTTSSN
ncbi:hypothetical protein HPB52_005435 [Rhipicephalus sanguineus]|uniref:Endonuclease/exonuclease/phosphatase domain-containing protein n=1 Tax=Rhipicephalus sanguineus TaxID=34632 RepID=A0A9D4SQD4_RHISA|nr:hypothetical protein HPB52_005435 [Rhipicephalus sanguineus]